MSVKIDNDKVFQLVKQLGRELNNREMLALIDGLVFQLNWEHGNRTVRKQLENYMRCRGINTLWLSEVIEKSFKDTKGAI
jgi:hypothetical protein